MKLIRQFLVIAGVSFLGEGLKALIPAPIPASVYGLILMLLSLSLGILRPHHVREAARFLIEIMPVMFIPAAVGLVSAWEALRPMLLPVGAITVISTVAVLAATGRAAQGVIRLGERRRSR